ncbi:MAG: antibiotic biosynthesis monooxygenase [Granulosicoccus sp.]
MIAVIFEVVLADGCRDRYLEIAAELRPLLDSIDGFISVERFQSLNNPDWLLSLSFFTDEKAVKQWRAMAAHRAAQSEGRGSVFADYRLRVAHVVRGYGKGDRVEAPDDSQLILG